jgi:Multicopper oxidase
MILNIPICRLQLSRIWLPNFWCRFCVVARLLSAAIHRYNDGTTGPDRADDIVSSGQEVELTWDAIATSGPGPGEMTDSKLWIYHGHKGEIADTYAGLFGAVLVVANNSKLYDDETLERTDGVDEMFLHFSVNNEGGSFHLDDNIVRVDGNRELDSAALDALKQTADFQESNRMHAINGFMYCNGIPAKQLAVGRPVRLYMYALGAVVDFHSILFGNEALHFDNGISRGSAKLLAGTFVTGAVAIPDSASARSGVLEIRCGVDDHLTAGMRMLADVAAGNFTASPPPNVNVTYFIGADEVEWDYAASGKNLCSGEVFGDAEKVFTAAGPNRPGSRYVKAQYSTYEDATFAARKTDSNGAFSGIVGPLLHFEVGDTFNVVFRNNLSFAANLNFHGLQILATSLAKFGDGVAPGAEATYTWTVPAWAGPGPKDNNSTAYVYYSSVDPIGHAHAGLTGVVSVTGRGSLNRATSLPKDREVVVPLLLNIFRENDSPLIQKSLAKFANGSVSDAELAALRNDIDWLESNAMHSANGFSYCNNPMMEFAEGSTVRWIVFGYGSEASMHAPFFGSQVILGRSRRAAGVQIFPYLAEAVEVLMATPGKSSVGCVVVDHFEAGMFARVSVV